MNLASIGTALGLFVLKAVEFAQNLEGNAYVIFGEGIDAARIVDQDIGVENEILANR